MNDSALETLLWPFVEGRLAWPEGGALFLRARDGWPLRQRTWPGLVCEQSFKPDADALLRAGFEVVGDPHPPLPLVLHMDVRMPRSAGMRERGRPLPVGEVKDRKFPLVLLLPPRQRDEARALMARAIEATSEGGRVIACMSNNEGARSGQADLERLTGSLEVASKNKCRVFWTTGSLETVDRALLAQWRELDAVRPIEDGRFVSRPGVFAWDHVDVASKLLASHLPDSLAGHAADLGAGFGYLSTELLIRCPRITSLDVYEAEGRALDLARRNLASFAHRAELAFHWHDVTQGLRRKYDVIVTNPPFHAQRGVDRPDIGRRFISVAAESLHSKGRLWLVANRHLPYEAVLTQEFGTARTVVQQHGFKIVEAVRRGSG
jgi:16S rRNA (guanine1207-N2)-methyltransferase